MKTMTNEGNLRLTGTLLNAQSGLTSENGVRLATVTFEVLQDFEETTIIMPAGKAEFSNSNEMLYGISDDEILTLVPVQGVSIVDAGQQIQLKYGVAEQDTAHLEYQIAPADATNKAVVWSSSDENVVTVTPDGELEATGPGTAMVTVTTVDGGHTASIQVVVESPVTGISFDYPEDEPFVMLPEETTTLYYSIEPYDAANPEVQWSSSAPDIASVDEWGNVTAWQPGTATITVATADGGVSDSIDVHVASLDGEFGLSASKGIVGYGEYVKINVSNTSATHDVTRFQVYMIANPYLWDVYNVVPHEDIADRLLDFKVNKFGSQSEAFGIIVVEGQLEPGESGLETFNPEELFTVYLQHKDNYEEVSDDFVALVLLGAMVQDSSGNFHTIANGGFEDGVYAVVPIANPDLDGYLGGSYEGVGVSDLVKVAKVYGKEIEWYDDGGLGSHDPDHIYDFNRDGKIDLVDVTFIHMRVLIKGFDPDVPDGIDPLPETPSS